MTLSSVVKLTVATLLATIVACEPTSDDDAQPAPPEAPLVLDGVYTPDDEASGPIDELELKGGRYRFLANGCNDADCEQQGSFVHDAAGAQLKLVADGSGVSFAIPFEVDETEESEEPEIAPGADTFSPVLGVIQLGEHGNVQPAQTRRLLDRRNVRLVRRARLLKRKYARQIVGGCSAQQISYAQGECRNRVCPSVGGQSKGLNYCSAATGKASCACTGGTAGGGACGAAQRQYRQCMDRASVTHCGRILDCNYDFANPRSPLGNCSRPVIRGGCAGYGSTR